MKLIYLNTMQQELADTPLDASECLSEGFYFFPVGTLKSEVCQWIEDTTEGKKVSYKGAARRITG